MKRDPNRIYAICLALGAYWESVPDLRLGQLFNILQHRAGNDLFYMEDDQLLNLLNDTIAEMKVEK